MEKENPLNFDFNLDFNFDFNEKEAEEADELPRPKQGRSECIKRTDKNIYRRAFSETQLLDILSLDMKDGESYHVITGGDVDALSYLKVILRQQNLEYCLFSTYINIFIGCKNYILAEETEAQRTCRRKKILMRLHNIEVGAEARGTEHMEVCIGGEGIAGAMRDAAKLINDQAKAYERAWQIFKDTQNVCK
jgi:hypothetical protein